MSRRKHKPTPGPWKWDWRLDDHKETQCGIYHEERPGHARAVVRCPRYQTREQWEADARLIVAGERALKGFTGPLDAVREGDFQEALDHIEELLENLDDPFVLTEARKFLDRFEPEGKP